MLATYLKGATAASVQDGFIASSINRAASVTSLSVTAPSGIRNGDLLVCFFYAATQSTGNLPASFTTAYTENSSSNPRIKVGWKVASSESGNYTFTTSSSSNLVATVLVYRGASFNTVGVITRLTTFSSPIRAPEAKAASITPTDQGILLASFTSNNATGTPDSSPSGMTLRSNTTGSVNAPSLYVYDEELTSSGATGDRLMEWDAGSATSGILLSVS
jgi:hypothetical protein